MINLSKILDTGTWKNLANVINENFTKLSQGLDSANKNTVVKLPLFGTVSEAQTSISSPYEGQLILIGDTIPAQLYKWNGSAWEDTGKQGGGAAVDLNAYYTKEEIDSEKVFVKNTRDVTI